MQPLPEDDESTLEHAREHLYEPGEEATHTHPLLDGLEAHVLPHQWEEPAPQSFFKSAMSGGTQHVKKAWIFFIGALLFFLVAAGAAGYVFFSGGNAVSVDKIMVDIQGPTTLAGGDTIPLSLTITNRNSVPIQNGTIAIDFPSGTRDATDVLKPYPHYIENLGTIESGASVTRSVKAVVFGGAGEKLSLPVAFSYGTGGSNARFMKNTSYELLISTTPLSVAVDTLAETTSGQPLILTLTVTSNAPVPIENIVLVGALPFGFMTTSSSLPINNSSFLIGTLPPGAHKTVTLTGTLIGQDNEQRVFHFTVGTAQTPRDQALAVTYMTQDANVKIAAPFINTTLALNGDTSANVVVAPGTPQTITLSYANTLPTSITDAVISVTLAGAAVDYNSIRASGGFYNSANHTIVFSKDTDPTLAVLAPGASGIGTFTFQTLPANAALPAPAITFTTSVLGTRVGQTNVSGQVSSSATKVAKVATAIALTAAALHSSGPLVNNGPVPPHSNQTTTYTIAWSAQNPGSAVAGGTMTTVLPNYVTYTGKTSGGGTFSYNDASRMVTWNIGNLAQGARAQGYFQVSITPSTSQRGGSPNLTKTASFSGYDRFAGVQISATADPATTETRGDPGYSPADGTVQ